MDAILEPIGEFWEGFLSNPVVQLATQLIVVYVVLLWLGTAYWAFRDMQARTENPILPYFAAALIIFFTPLLFLFAVVLYLIVRPRETLAEVYERSLAEESLIAEVEKNELCPVCRDRVDNDWLVCPNCRTRLHRVCPSCNKLAEPTWPLCAFCGFEFERARGSARQPAAAASASSSPSAQTQLHPAEEPIPTSSGPFGSRSQGDVQSPDPARLRRATNS